MRAAGLAWHHTRSSQDTALAAADREARAARRGLWVDAEPMPPWDWRTTERDRKRQPAKLERQTAWHHPFQVFVSRSVPL